MERPDRAKNHLMLHRVRDVLQLPAPLGSTVKRKGRRFGSPGAIKAKCQWSWRRKDTYTHVPDLPVAEGPRKAWQGVLRISS